MKGRITYKQTKSGVVFAFFFMTRDRTGRWEILHLALFNLFGKTFPRENSK